MPFLNIERAVYYRERASRYYSPWSYGLIISVVEMPYLFVQVG